MGAIGRFWRSTIGKKVVMAVTGILLIGFIIGHVVGNLLMFRGAEAMNAYAALLKANMGLLWAARAGLLAATVLHVVAAVQLTRRQQRARPTGYDTRSPQVSTWASRTIRWGGAVLLLFVVYHLLHFTTGTLHPTFSHTNVYGNVISAFRTPWIAAIYLVATAALGLHLFHGTWSSVRTLGLTRPTYDPLKRRVAMGLALFVWLGFTAIVVAVFAGAIGG